MDSPERPAFSFAALIPTGFYTRSYEALFFQRWKSGLHGLVWGWDRLLPRYPSQFLSITHECGTACSASHHHCHATTTPRPLCLSSLSLPLLPVQMNRASLNLWLLDFHTVHFLAVLGVIYFEISSDPSYGCARRKSLSIYTSILTRSPQIQNSFTNF